MAVARSGVAATPPSPIAARATTPSRTSRAKADRDAGDVVEPPLGDLVEGGQRRERQRDPHDAGSARPAPARVCAVAGEVVGQRHLALAASGPASTTDASSASSAGGASPIGEPVPRLPPRVAPLRISRDANCGNSWSSSGTRPSSSRSISDRVSAAPISMTVVRRRRTCAARAAGRRRRRTAARAPRRLTSTPQSVQPATTVASGRSASSASASPRFAGPDELGSLRPRPGWARPPVRATAQRAASVVVPGRCAERVGGVPDRPVAGAAAQVPAQRVQVEPVGAVLVIPRVPVGGRIGAARSGR